MTAVLTLPIFLANMFFRTPCGDLWLRIKLENLLGVWGGGGTTKGYAAVYRAVQEPQPVLMFGSSGANLAAARQRGFLLSLACGGIECERKQTIDLGLFCILRLILQTFSTTHFIFLLYLANYSSGIKHSCVFIWNFFRHLFQARGWEQARALCVCVCVCVCVRSASDLLRNTAFYLLHTPFYFLTIQSTSHPSSSLRFPTWKRE